MTTNILGCYDLERFPVISAHPKMSQKIDAFWRAAGFDSFLGIRPIQDRRKPLYYKNLERLTGRQLVK